MYRPAMLVLVGLALGACTTSSSNTYSARDIGVPMETSSATVPDHAPEPGHQIPGRPAGSLAERVRMLQRRIGNQAMLRLLAQRSSGPSRTGPGDHHEQASAANPPFNALASRSVPVEDATVCRTNVQAKTAVNQPGDVYEREADDVAGQIMRAPEPQPGRSGPGARGSQRQSEQPDHEREHLQTDRVQAGATGQIATLAVVGAVLRSVGQQLEPGARHFMEQRFGRDFGAIRVHTDPAAATGAAALGAEAFTVGRPIAVARDRCLPGPAHG